MAKCIGNHIAFDSLEMSFKDRYFNYGHPVFESYIMIISNIKSELYSVDFNSK